VFAEYVTEPTRVPHRHAQDASQSAAEIHALVIQPELTIGSAGDPLETEADHVADQILSVTDRDGTPTEVSSRAGGPAVRRWPASGTSRVDSTDRQLPKQAEAVDDHVLGSPPHPLDAPARSFMEPRFRRNLANVRIHTDAAAATSAESLGAAAYTYGHHIVFNQGQYDPRGRAGLRLIAHELAHVLQQGRGRAAETTGDENGNPTAKAATLNMARPSAAVGVTSVAAPYIARQPKEQGADHRAAQTVITRPVRFRHIYKKSPCPTGTGIGHFDEVEYNTETHTMTVTVRPTFHFPPFQASDYPREIREDPLALRNAAREYEARKDAFVGSFVRQAEAWGGHHAFYCHEPPIVGERAVVRVDADLTYAKASPASPTESTTAVTVVDKDAGEHTGTSGSMVVTLGGSVGMRYDAAANVMIPESVGPFDLPPVLGEGGATPGAVPGSASKPKAPQEQLTLMHELGHVFGLGDEYVNRAKPGYGQGEKTTHSELAKSMLQMTVGHGGDNATIMAQGNDIRTEHGVTFLSALRTVTGLRWEFNPPA
jgi:hypothetical protein